MLMFLLMLPCQKADVLMSTLMFPLMSMVQDSGQGHPGAEFRRKKAPALISLLRFPLMWIPQDWTMQVLADHPPWWPRAAVGSMAAPVASHRLGLGSI